MRRTTFFILCLGGAVVSFNVAACAALVPSIAADFSSSPFFAGKIIWLYMLPYGIAALVYGPLARAYEAKNIELACMFFFSLSNLLAGLSRNIYALFAARFFMGVFGASVIPLGLILIARQSEGKHRGRNVGIFFSITFIASLLGLFLSAIIHWRIIFFIPAIFGLILCMYIYFYLPVLKADKGNFKINYSACAKNKKLISIFTYIFFISFVYHGVQQWLAVYFSGRFGLSQFLISILITLTSLSGIFGEALGGFLADYSGRLNIIRLGAILMIGGIFSLIFNSPFNVLVLIMLVWGLGWTFNHAGLSTLITDLPDEFLNEAASLNSSVRFVSGGLGVAVGGLLMQRNFMFGFFAFGLSLTLLAVVAKKLLVIK